MPVVYVFELVGKREFDGCYNLIVKRVAGSAGNVDLKIGGVVIVAAGVALHVGNAGLRCQRGPVLGYVCHSYVILPLNSVVR